MSGSRLRAALAGRRALDALVGLAIRRPMLVLAVTVLAALAGAVGATRLDVAAGTDTLVGGGSDVARATERWRERFGDDAVYVMVRGDLARNILDAETLGRLVGLEGCIAGNPPRGTPPAGGDGGAGGVGGPCRRLAADRPVMAVLGPGTFISQSLRQLQVQFAARQAAARRRADATAEQVRTQARERGASRRQAEAVGEQARAAVGRQFTGELIELGVRYGLGPQDLQGPQFISRIVCDATGPLCTPKQRFSYLFPNADGGTGETALIQVRLKPGLGDARRRTAIEDVRAAVAMPQWRLEGGSYLVSGAPVVVADLTASVTGSIVVLLIAAGLVMAATLALVFRTRLRVLPLAVALAAAGLTFGGLSLAGASLTMASIAVLPVLIGLAVDYAIQLQSRVEEARLGGLCAADAARRVARVGAPTVITAAAATAAGFLVLLLSPVPMVAGFGGLLVVGVLCALALALSAGVAALVLVHDGRARAPARLGPSLRGARDIVRPVGRAAGAAGRLVARSARGAAQLTGAQRLAGFSGRLAGALGACARGGARATLDAALRRPVRILGVALLLALAGWALDTQLAVESDVQRLVPASLPALADLEALQQASGVGGTIDVLVEGDDVSDPRVVSWMADFQDRVLAQAGPSADRGCGAATLCPAFSLTDLLGGGSGGASAAPPDRAGIEALLGAVPPDRAGIEALLGAVPAYFTRSVISEDRRAATLSFAIRLMPLDRQQEVVEAMRAQLDPPGGVDAELVGLPVLAARANAETSSHPRRVLTLLAGLLAVALVLLVALGAPRRALVPLAPIVLATGWSALVLFVLGVPLNPMSVTLGALVIAISTEFSVLLSERYRAERARGLPAAVALRATYASTGTAVLASGLTAIAGFAVLVVSDIRMLRDFGAVTVVDLGVSLLGVLVVLPAVLVVAERPQLLREGMAGAGAAVAGLRPRPSLRLRRPSPPRPRRRRAHPRQPA